MKLFSPWLWASKRSNKARGDEAPSGQVVMESWKQHHFSFFSLGKQRMFSINWFNSSPTRNSKGPWTMGSSSSAISSSIPKKGVGGSDSIKAQQIFLPWFTDLKNDPSFSSPSLYNPTKLPRRASHHIHSH